MDSEGDLQKRADRLLHRITALEADMRELEKQYHGQIPLWNNMRASIESEKIDWRAISIKRDYLLRTRAMLDAKRRRFNAKFEEIAREKDALKTMEVNWDDSAIEEMFRNINAQAKSCPIR